MFLTFYHIYIHYFILSVPAVRQIIIIRITILIITTTTTIIITIIIIIRNIHIINIWL